MKNPVAWLRTTALAEAISYVLLLGVAMPLKYAWDWPFAVHVLGTVHGVLFLVFCHTLVKVAFGGTWPAARLVAVFVAAVVPLATFVIDRRMRAWVAQARGAAG